MSGTEAEVLERALTIVIREHDMTMAADHCVEYLDFLLSTLDDRVCGEIGKDGPCNKPIGHGGFHNFMPAR